MISKIKYIGLILGFIATSTYAQNQIVPIWPNGAPGAISNDAYIESVSLDEFNTIKGISKISQPNLTVFLADSITANGASVIVCPGGGYTHLAINKEGYKVAQWLNTFGISAFVLKYRMPSNETMINKTIGPLQDAQEAVRIVRANAKKWNINPDKIGVLGFSAGGHLASTIATHYNDNVYLSHYETSARPDFSILIYPVISMEDDITHKGSKLNLLGENPSSDLILKYSNDLQINASTPPTFLVHATDDTVVPVENSINYYISLKNNKVPAEIHIYENGGHGFGLGRNGTNTNWPKACENWLIANTIIPKKTAYLFSYVKDDGEKNRYLSYSEDVNTWKPLVNDSSIVAPKVGKDSLIHDSYIFKGDDGLFHMVWTMSWTDNCIGYTASKDLIYWSDPKFIPVMSPLPSAPKM